MKNAQMAEERVNTYSLVSGFKTSVSSDWEAMAMRLSLLAPLGGLLASEFGGGAGRDTTGFKIISGIEDVLGSGETPKTASTSSVFGGLDGIGLPPHCVCDRCRRQRNDPACFVGAHRQVIFTGALVDTIVFFTDFFDEILAHGTAETVTGDFSPEEGACGFSTAFKRFEACILLQHKTKESNIHTSATWTPNHTKDSFSTRKR